MRNFKRNPYTVCVNYVNETGKGITLQCAELLEKAFRTIEGIKIVSIEEAKENEPDLVVNTLPLNGFIKGKKSVWWDLETAEYQLTQFFDDADAIFFPNHRNVQGYEPWREKAYFLPLATDPDYFRYHKVPIEYDVGFVGREDGNREIRRAGLDALEAHCKEKGYRFLRIDRIPRGEENSKMLSRCLLTLQLAGLRNIEQRLFETAAIRPLLADRQETNEKEIDMVVEPSVHYIPYYYYFDDNDFMVKEKGHWEDLFKQVDFYLANPEAREAIVENAREHMFKNHTYRNRAETILKIAGGEEWNNQ